MVSFKYNLNLYIACLGSRRWRDGSTGLSSFASLYSESFGGRLWDDVTYVITPTELGNWL